MLVHVVVHVLRRHPLKRILKPNCFSVVWIRKYFSFGSGSPGP
jgi:hypothetical protein